MNTTLTHPPLYSQAEVGALRKADLIAQQKAREQSYRKPHFRFLNTSQVVCSRKPFVDANKSYAYVLEESGHEDAAALIRHSIVARKHMLAAIDRLGPTHAPSMDLKEYLSGGDSRYKKAKVREYQRLIERHFEVLASLLTELVGDESTPVWVEGHAWVTRATRMKERDLLHVDIHSGGCLPVVQVVKDLLTPLFSELRPVVPPHDEIIGNVTHLVCDPPNDDRTATLQCEVRHLPVLESYLECLVQKKREAAEGRVLEAAGV